MTYNANFPVSADVLANPTSLTNRDDAGFELHGVISRIQDILEALEAKVGIGSSTPPATAAVLRRTATGASGWGQVQAGDISLNAISSGHIVDGQIATADLAAGAVTSQLSTAIGANAGFSGTSSTPMTNGTLATIASTSGGPILFLFNLYGIFRSALGTTTITFEVWDSAMVVQIGRIDVISNSTQIPAVGYAIAVPAAGLSKAYILTWRVDTGTVAVSGGTFAAIELKR